MSGTRRYDIVHKELSKKIQEITRLENGCWFPFRTTVIKRKVTTAQVLLQELNAAEDVMNRAIEVFEPGRRHVRGEDVTALERSVTTLLYRYYASQLPDLR